MGSHSETASRNSVEAALERLSKRADKGFEELSSKPDAGFDNIDRRLRQQRWRIDGLYVYLTAWLIWFIFELRS